MSSIDGVGAVVEDGGGEGGVGLAFGEHFDEVFGLARAAGGDDGNAGGAGDGAGQGAVEAGLDAVGVHGGEQDFAGAERFAARGPFDGVDAFVDAAAFGVDVPAAAGALRRASMASTTACAPNSLLSSVISSGRRTAAVLTLTLSAPAMQDAAGVGDARGCRRRR